MSTDRLPAGNVVVMAVALLGFAFYLWLFYPGVMSFDSANQYWQVRTGQWNSMHPVIMVAHWWLFDQWQEGPGGLFVYFMALFFLGTYGIAKYSGLTAPGQVALVLLMTLLPFNLMILPHLWKDVGLLVYSLLSVALVLRFERYGMRRDLWLALALLVAGALFRINGSFFVLPLAVFIGWRLFQHAPKFRVALLATLMFLGAVVASDTVLRTATDTKKSTLWPILALWDLASVSQQTDEWLVPGFVTGGYEFLDQLEAENRVWSSLPVFYNTQPGFNLGLNTPHSPDEYQELFTAWVSMISRHPVEYTKHRLAVTGALWGLSDKTGYPIELMFIERSVSYQDNPVFEDSSHPWRMAWIAWLKSHPSFKPVNGALYVAIGLGLITMMVFGLFKNRANRNVALACLVCAFLGLASLVWTAPSAEVRYLTSFVNFIIVAAALLLLPQRQDENDRLLFNL